MTERVLYNEIDPFAAQWLRNLIAAGYLPAGVVDERPIQEIKGAELAGLRQFHAFAGIGGWSLALQLAGWPKDREVWTGSCPCQPFSSAGKAGGLGDERHLWPAFYRLIAERRPAIVFGEQVASKAGRLWLSGVRVDLEGLGYAVGAADLCAAGIGAPHIRQRLYWVADTKAVRGKICNSKDKRPTQGEINAPGDDSHPVWLDNPTSSRYASAGTRESIESKKSSGLLGMGREVGWLEHHERDGRKKRRCVLDRVAAGGCGENSWFGDSRTIQCTDGTARRVGRGIFPLAYGIPRGLGSGQPVLRGLARRARRNRTGRLRGYGNAIIPSLAAEFARAYMEGET